MDFESVLPEGFDGTFRFTNPTDEDFIGKWGSKEYIFPKQTTSPITILNATPVEIQQIRKKFAKDLAEREFFKSEKYQVLMKQERNPDGSARAGSIHAAGTYSIDDLAPFIQKCLEPLPTGHIGVRDAGLPPLEEHLSLDDDGQLSSAAIKTDNDLKNLAQGRTLRKKAMIED